MTKRIFLFLFLILLVAAGQRGAAAFAEIQPRAFVYPPDTLRIPGTITLLAETPYYANPSEAEAPVGSFSPQTELRVLSGAYSWARTQSWWMVDSPDGPVWTYPLPWNVVVPPPETVMLFKDTPLYELRDESSAYAVVPTSQPFAVVEADPMWFYTNDPNEKHWLRVRSETLGERWVFLPVSQIGFVKPVDYYAYYGSQALLDNPHYSGPLVTRAGPLFPSLFNQTVHVIGEYVTIYATSYLIETEYGSKYVKEKGREVVRGVEQLTLKSDTPLYTIPETQAAWLPVIPAQTVESFEKMADAPLYHVHTEIGDVWINPEDSEPTDWVEPDYAIELKGRHELYRFPKTSFSIQGAFLEGRTVQPQGYWQDAYGTGWYLLETSVGKVWFTLKPAQDRIIPKDGSPSAHVAYKQTIIDTVQVKESELMAGRTPIGYLAEDLPYLSLDYVTQRFGYALETGSQSLISIRSTEPASEYSLQINPANGEVTTYWADQAAERLTLQHMLKSEDGGRYWIAGEDAERLLGLSIDWWSNGRDTFYLFSDEYEVELTPLPSSTRQPALPYLVNRFERPVGPNDAKPREPLRIGLANLAASAPSASEWSYSESRSNEFLPKVSWVRQNGSIPIAPGSNELRLTVKIGAKILAQQTTTLIGEL